MVKLVQCITRRRHLGVEQFRAAWEAYGERLRRAAPGLGAVRVTLSTTLDTPLNEALAETRASIRPFDGVAEIAWPDGAAIVAGAAPPGTSEQIARLRATQEAFADASRSAFFFVHELELLGERETAGN